MALAKATIEALVQMADVLRQSADEILASKSEMDGQLRSFPWDDPIGQAFLAQYEEDFKPLKEKLLPNMESYITHIMGLEGVVESYSESNAAAIGAAGIAGGVGIGVAASFVAPIGKQARFTGIPKEPLNVSSPSCDPLRKTARDYYNEWAYKTTENGERSLRKYVVTSRNPDGTESKKILTAENYKEFDKETFVKALSTGMGFKYEEKDLGPIKKLNNGKLSGALGNYDPKSDVLNINKNVFSSDFVQHEDIVEIVFHENQHRNQQIRMDKGCLDFVPKYVKVDGVCVQEILNAEKGNDISEKCMNQYMDYSNQWSEREATEVGTGARRAFTQKRR